MPNVLTSYDPANGEEIWRGPEADEASVRSAVNTARKGFSSWSRTTPEDRASCVEAFSAVLEKNRDLLAETISRETGKPLWDAHGEVNATIGKISISLSAYRERTGTKHSMQGSITQQLRHHPHGVMAVFGPYNFPAHLPNGHIVPALLAGNTVVFKPSEETPLVGETYLRFWREAGLPQDVLLLVQGAKETGRALAKAAIDGLLFTGSYDTGKILHAQFGGRPEILLALEMGGNNPLIVWDVADVYAAALLVVQSAYLSSGQRCTCARRLILPHGAPGDELLDALLSWIGKIRIGAYTDAPEPFMGPLIHARQAQAMLNAQSRLLQTGGIARVEMRSLPQGEAFVSPGVIDVTHAHDREDKEYFGPLLQVIRVADFDAALREANATRFGLAAGLVSDNCELWEHFLQEIRAGVVNWNRPTTGASSAAPFGGVGQSGNHRPSAYYAADYCAWPKASLLQEQLLVDIPNGISV